MFKVTGNYRQFIGWASSSQIFHLLYPNKVTDSIPTHFGTDPHPNLIPVPHNPDQNATLPCTAEST
jgi:hypothetical protein